MVMETPSPQCVGREFVRQYYTLLHEAPEYLHRFYSHNSCFVHGGVEKPGEEQPPVQGQADIHKKILSLNFDDCHAKIRQVDSQSTVGNAVVVQVTGELSNNGQPMRRFMQTFILAPQSPKKYYVHNDIFRYQDEVFHDNDTDTDVQEDIATEEQFHDSETEHGELVTPGEHVHDPVCEVPSFYKEPDTTAQSQGVPVSLPPASQAILSNGNAATEERPDSPEQEEEKGTEVVDEKGGESEGEAPTQEFEAVQEQEKLPEPEEETHEEPVQEPKSFSWAFVTSKNTSVGGGNVMASKPASSAPKPMPVHQPATKPAEKPDSLRDGPKPPREQRDPRPQRRERESSRGTGEPEEFRRSRYPDTHQLFVGNLPHNIQERELKEHFENYGKVVEVRINRKSNSRDVPNFGFVVFEDSQTVLTVLESKPILFRGDHRLNVEEKKQRGEQMGRPVSGNRMGRGGGGGPGGPGGMGGRMGGGPGGPGGRGGRGGGPGGRSDRGGGPGDRGGRGGGGFGAPRR